MSERVTITIPDDLYQRASRIAQLREKRVEDVLLESIALVETELSMLGENANLNREEAAFRRMHPMLREKHYGQYVAIHDEKLVDYDDDQVALYLRVKEKYPERFVWISPVQSEPDETYHIRSPRSVELD